MTTQTLPEQIRSYRQEQRLTQSDMGALLGVTGSAVGQWETGATTPRGKHHAAIQRILREEQPYQPEVLRPEQIPARVVELSAASVICPDNMTLREYKEHQTRSISPAFNLSHYDDPDVIAAVSMHPHGGHNFGPHLMAFHAFGFSDATINQALTHIQDAPQVWVWPACKPSLIALAKELKGQLYMRSMGSFNDAQKQVVDRDIGRLDSVLCRLGCEDIITLAAEPNPQEITIDWQGLVSDHQGIRGVSLRHLMSLGLYATYQRATEALDRAAVGFLPTSLKTITCTNTGGRPSEDTIITDLRLVQMFCVCAQTPLGVQIRDVVIAHHNELQAMLAGDEAANARHEQAKLPEHPKEIDPLDALSSMISQLREQRDRQRALEREMEATRAATQLTAELVTDQAQRLADVETRLNTAPIAGHLSAYQIAERGGYLSSTGRPHASAVVALGDIMGLEEEGHVYLVMTEINEHICPTRRYTPVGAAMLSRELARLARAAKAPFFNVIAGSKTYTVYRAQ